MRKPKASLIGASQCSLAGRSAGSLHDVTETDVSDRSSDRLGSSERLAASSNNSLIDNNDVESDYDDDR